MAKKKKGSSALQNEILGVVLLALGVLVILALVTYHEADPPGGTHKVVKNMIGMVGAYGAHFLVSVLGRIASYIVPIMLGMWGYVLLRSSDYKPAAVRTVYIAAYTVIFCTMASIPYTTPDTTVRMGGLLGLVISTATKEYLGEFGSYIMLATLLLVLVLVTTEFKLFRILEWLRKASLFVASQVTTLATLIRKQWQEYSKQRKIRQDLKKKQARTQALIKQQKQAKTEKAAPEPDTTEAKTEPAVVEGAAPAGENAEQPPAKAEPVIGNIMEAKRVDAEAVEKKRKEKNQELKEYRYPGLDIFDSLPEEADREMPREELLENAQLLEKALAEFGVQVEVLAVNPGPVITQYEVRPAAGVKVSKIVGLAEDLALKMKAKGVRVVPNIVGKGAVGIELPNRHPSIVYMRDVISSEAFQNADTLLTLGIGKTVGGDIICVNLDKMPHLLVAGATGSGKSVCINTIIASLVFRASPQQLRFIMVDPKRLELSMYRDIPHLLHPVITDSRMAPDVLEWAIREMEDRYKKLAALSVRDLDGFNEKVKALPAEELAEYAEDEDQVMEPMPYIVIIVDELAEVMLATEARVEEPITRLAQMARAVGIHLILATQRPSVDVITGVIKANFPSRIAFKVAQRNDSRTILDANGAESLLGNGDMLYTSTEHPKAVRYHGAFISTKEVERLANFLRKQKIELENIDLEEAKKEQGGGGGFGAGGRDELFDQALRLVVTHQQGSISLLQRRLKVGYSRAARLIDELEEAGVVGAFDGSKAREVLVDQTYLESLSN